jgi:hypothetical protein
MGGYINKGDEWGCHRGSNMVYPFPYIIHQSQSLRSLPVNTPTLHLIIIMANPAEIQDYMFMISQFTWAQLTNELQRLTNLKIEVIEYTHQLDQHHNYVTQAITNNLTDINIRIEALEDRQSQVGYLTQTPLAVYIRDSLLLCRGRELYAEVDDDLEQHRLAYRAEVVFFRRHLDRLDFLSSLVNMASILKAERGDQN